MSYVVKVIKIVTLSLSFLSFRALGAVLSFNFTSGQFVFKFKKNYIMPASGKKSCYLTPVFNFVELQYSREHCAPVLFIGMVN